MSLTLTNVGLNLIYYALTLVLLPGISLLLETYFAFIRRPFMTLRIASVALAIAGAALQLWCITVFQSTGKGTPSPALPPKRLVTDGPYKFVRNPMNIGELMLLLALAGWFASPLLFTYCVIAALAFHVFVLVWEEPEHRRQFGPTYVRYASSVNRWLPAPANRKIRRAGTSVV